MTDVRGEQFDGIDVVAKLGDGPHSFIECTFRGANLEEGRWAESRFEACDLGEASFIDADLGRTTWMRCAGVRPNFSHADLTDARFEHCDFVEPKFEYTDIGGVVWSDCKLANARFHDVRGVGWDMRASVVRFASLVEMSFRGKRLVGLDLTESDLSRADFREAVFEGCLLRDTLITGARFEGADLRGADLGRVTDLSALVGAIISPRQAAALATALGLIVVDE